MPARRGAGNSSFSIKEGITEGLPFLFKMGFENGVFLRKSLKNRKK
jgi:hypothetical protein